MCSVYGVKRGKAHLNTELFFHFIFPLAYYKIKVRLWTRVVSTIPIIRHYAGPTSAVEANSKNRAAYFLSPLHGF